MLPVGAEAPTQAEQDVALLARARAAVAAIRAEHDCWSGAHCRLTDPERGRVWMPSDEHEAALVRNRRDLHEVLDERQGRLQALLAEHVPAARAQVPRGCIRRPAPDDPVELRSAIEWLATCPIACAACANAARALLDELDHAMRAAAQRNADDNRIKSVDRLVCHRDRLLLRVIAEGADHEGAVVRELEKLSPKHKRSGNAVRTACNRLRVGRYDGLEGRGFAVNDRCLRDLQRWFPGWSPSAHRDG